MEKESESNKEFLKKQAYDKLNEVEWPGGIKNKLYSLITNIIDKNDTSTINELNSVNRKIKNEIILQISFVTPDIENYIDKIPELENPKPERIDYYDLIYQAVIDDRITTRGSIKLKRYYNNINIALMPNQTDDKNEYTISHPHAERQYLQIYKEVYGYRNSNKRAKSLLQMYQGLNAVIDMQNEMLLNKGSISTQKK